jgi:hypothetical protein
MSKIVEIRYHDHVKDFAELAADDIRKITAYGDFAVNLIEDNGFDTIGIDLEFAVKGEADFGNDLVDAVTEAFDEYTEDAASEMSELRKESSDTYTEFWSELHGFEDWVFGEIAESPLPTAITRLNEWADAGWGAHGVGYSRSGEAIEEHEGEILGLIEQEIGGSDVMFYVVANAKGSRIYTLGDLHEHLVGRAMEIAARNIASKAETYLDRL